MAPAHMILTPSEMETAEVLLKTKPPTISHEQFSIIKQEVLGGTPQAEYLLVSWVISF